MTRRVRIETPKELVVTFLNGHIAGKLCRHVNSTNSPKQHFWVLKPSDHVGSETLRELADLLDEQNAKEPLREELQSTYVQNNAHSY